MNTRNNFNFSSLVLMHKLLHAIYQNFFPFFSFFASTYSLNKLKSKSMENYVSIELFVTKNNQISHDEDCEERRNNIDERMLNVSSLTEEYFLKETTQIGRPDWTQKLSSIHTNSSSIFKTKSKK